MNEGHHKPFPEIVLTPEEREEKLKNNEPKLDGAPEADHESVLLAGELNLPQPDLETVTKDIKAFGGIDQSEKRQNFIREKFKSLFANAKNWETYFDTLRIIETEWPEHKTEAGKFAAAFEERMLKNLEREDRHTPEILGKWLELYTNSVLYKDTAEKVLKSLFAKTRTTKQMIDLMYNLAVATVYSGDQKTLLKGGEILLFGTPIAPLEPEKLKLFVLGFYMEDDNIVRKYMELDNFVATVGTRQLPDLYQRGQEEIKKLSDDLMPFITKYAAGNPEKIQNIIRYTELSQKVVESGKLTGSVSAEVINSWPLKLLSEPGPLKRFINKMSMKADPTVLDIWTPNHGRGLFKTQNQKEINSAILHWLTGQNSENQVLSENEKVECAFYVQPELSDAQKQALVLENIKLREAIYKEMVHSISPRGDTVLITYPVLKDLEIKNITFELGDDNSHTKTKIKIANFEFAFQLDENYNLQEAGTGKPLEIPFEQRAFLEYAILGHLKELQCGTRIKPGAKDPENETARVQREKEFSGRRGHKRLMPPGYEPSAEAIEAARKERFRDIVKMNAEFGLTKATGMNTYVKVKDKVRIGGEKPLVSRAPHATDKLKEIMGSVEKEN